MPGADEMRIPGNSDDFPFLPVCSYRRVMTDGAGSTSYYVCACSGGLPIGTVAEEALALADICGPCNIPPELSPNRRACLFLVPVRLWEGGTLRTVFACRWFYFLKPKSLPGEKWQLCLGCPHWFPRTEEEADIPGMDRWIRKIIQMYWEPEPPIESLWSRRHAHVPPIWRKRIGERIRKKIGIPMPCGWLSGFFRRRLDKR